MLNLKTWWKKITIKMKKEKKEIPTQCFSALAWYEHEKEKEKNKHVWEKTSFKQEALMTFYAKEDYQKYYAKYSWEEKIYYAVILDMPIIIENHINSTDNVWSQDLQVWLNNNDKHEVIQGLINKLIAV